ncbi:MAG: MYXO-CTERM sorting domain-containing protein [Phycisphaerales bacterium JB054]
MRQITIAAMIAAGLATTPALADDFAPPGYRGDPLSVQAEWEFSRPFDSVDIFPEFFNAVGGQGTLFDGFTTKAELSSTSEWLWVDGDGDGGITPTNPDGALLSFKVQNWIDLEIEKLLRIQVTHQGAPPNIVGMTGFVGNDPFDGVFVGGAFVDDEHFYEDWSIAPNPWWEFIEVIVPFGTVLDEVVIDTVSLPTPGTASLAALAGLVALRRRR